MGKLAVLKNIFLICALVGVVYLVGNYGEPAKNQVFAVLHLPNSSVKGTSTQRAKEITGNIQTDVNNQVNSLEKQALNLRVSDALSFFSRVSKIPQDINSVQQYLSGQVGSVLKSKK